MIVTGSPGWLFVDADDGFDPRNDSLNKALLLLVDASRSTAAASKGLDNLKLEGSSNPSRRIALGCCKSPPKVNHDGTPRLPHYDGGDGSRQAQGLKPVAHASEPAGESGRSGEPAGSAMRHRNQSRVALHNVDTIGM
jgi:hypothetical protein